MRFCECLLACVYVFGCVKLSVRKVYIRFEALLRFGKALCSKAVLVTMVYF